METQCWDRQSCVRGLLTSARSLKNVSWSRTCPYKEIKNSHNLCWAYLFGNGFPCSRLNVYFFVLLKRVHRMAPGQPHCCSQQEGSEVLCLQHRPSPCADCRVRPTGRGGRTLTLEADSALSLLYVSSIVPSSAWVRRVFLGDPDICKPCSGLTAPAAPRDRQQVSLARH